MKTWRAKSIAAVIAFGALTGADSALAEDPFTRLITKNTASYTDSGLVLQDGSGVLFHTTDNLDPSDTDISQRDVYLNKDGVITFLTPGLAESVSLDLVGATDDGSTFYVETTGALNPTEDTDGSGTDVYAIKNGVATLVSTSQNDPQTLLSISRFEGVSPDGSTVYFRSDQQHSLTDLDGGGEDIFAYRPNDPIPDATQISTSASDPQDNTDAEFCGASDDGTVAAFAISSEMTGADTDGAGYDVYRHSSGTTTLASTSNQEAEPQIAGGLECRGVSRDGTAIAFESTIELFPADDDTNRFDVFTFDGLSTRWVSTSSLDPATNTHSRFADMSPDGDTVYFNTASPLLASDGNDADITDNDGYSVGPPGSGSVMTLHTGGTSPLDPEDGGATIKAVSKDGSAVIFTSGDRYVAADNDLDDTDIYARFNGGPVTFISTGPSDAGGSLNMNLQFDDGGPGVNRRWGVSADGSIIAYNTQAPLTNEDVDLEYDVYAHIIPKPVIAPPAVPPVVKDSVAPVITGAKLSNKTFATDKKIAALAAAKTKKGTKISFSLSEAASVKLAFQSRTTGRKSGSKCVKQTSKNKSAKSCTIVKSSANAKLTGVLGSNSKSFGGKIGSKTLKSGSYQLVITATDAAGNASTAKPVKFTIAKS